MRLQLLSRWLICLDNFRLFLSSVFARHCTPLFPGVECRVCGPFLFVFKFFPVLSGLLGNLKRFRNYKANCQFGFAVRVKLLTEIWELYFEVVVI